MVNWLLYPKVDGCGLSSAQKENKNKTKIGFNQNAKNGEKKKILLFLFFLLFFFFYMADNFNATSSHPLSDDALSSSLTHTIYIV